MGPRSRPLGRSLLVTVTLAVSLGLTGCGNQGEGYADADSGGLTYAHEALTKDEFMRTVAVAARKAGTSRTSIRMTGAVKLTARGDASHGKGRTLMSMKMSSPQMGQGTMAMRVVGRMLYLQIPGVTPPGKFLSVDTSDTKSPLARQFGGMSEQMDPMGNLQAVADSVRSVDRVGKLAMGGADTDHYKVVVDSAPMVKQMGAKTAQMAKIPDEIAYDFWLDQKNLVRRMAFQLPGVSFESTMSRWGKPVHVQKPAPDQIATLPQG